MPKRPRSPSRKKSNRLDVQRLESKPDIGLANIGRFFGGVLFGFLEAASRSDAASPEVADTKNPCGSLFHYPHLHSSFALKCTRTKLHKGQHFDHRKPSIRWGSDVE